MVNLSNMSEVRRWEEIPPSYGITHDDVRQDPDLWHRYAHQRRAVAKSGEPTWVIPSLEAITDPEYDGPFFNFYFGNEHRGMIIGNALDGFNIFEKEAEKDSIPIQLNREPICNQYEAQTTLVKYVRELIVAS